jgi:hypothetical protein
MKITLLQPRYPFGKRQAYLPGGLMNLGSRLLQIGVEVQFFDLNDGDWNEWSSALEESDLIGFTTIGPPYIPEIVGTIREMRQAGLEQTILVGGEGVSRLRPSDFQCWFSGLNVLQIRGDQDLATVCGMEVPDAFETSMVPMLKRLSEGQLRKYLTTEFSLFMSQGCAFNCAFCAADKARKEKYRSCETLVDEVEFICQYLRRVGHSELRVYITNLDAFQNAGELEERLQIVRTVCDRYGITPHIRCLATSRCTFKACQADMGLAQRLRDCGLEIVGFGADGADEETWARQNKKHNSLSELQEACRMMEHVGITVELLMVIGFQDDCAGTLWRDLVFSLRQAVKGRVIRPYLAKSQTPSARWPEGDTLVGAFLEDTDLLARLDYAMIGSSQTHPKGWHRLMTNVVYLTIIALLTPFGKCPTSPLIPVPVSKGIGRTIATMINRFIPFDR